MEISKTKANGLGSLNEARGSGAEAVGKNKATKETPKADGTLLETLRPKQNAENVKWSPEASLTQEAMQVARNQPEVRADKVKALKEAIKNGSYKVDEEKVAEKMLSDSLEEGLLAGHS